MFDKTEKNMYVSSASNKYYTSKQSHTTAFKAAIPVTYVQVDDLIYTKGDVFIDVIKAFVRRIKQGKPEDAELRAALRRATGDSFLQEGYQSIARIGNTVVTGPDAACLERIWSTNLPLAQKKEEASNFVKSLFYNRPMKNLMIYAKKFMKNGKPRYDIQNVSLTRYY